MPRPRAHTAPGRALTRFAFVVLSILAVVAAVAVVRLGPWRADRAEAQDAHSHQGHRVMTNAEMARWVRGFYATHPVRRGPALPEGSQVFFTFQVGNFFFSPFDTARILVNDIVSWNLAAGVHTVTSGENSGDPAAGAVFDAPLDESSPSFEFQFADPGIYPFFCRVHEGLMRGTVRVSPVLEVPSVPGDAGRLGFVTGPSPNPSRSGVRFRFALGQPGRASARVFDASGRLVATPFDRDLDSGSHAAAWDGRSTAGKQAAPGVYYLRLVVPGADQSKRIVIKP